MKLRPVPIISAILISSVLLFGGWFVYQNTAIKAPIEELIQGIPGIVKTDIQLDRNTVNLTLELADDAELRSIYEQINTKSKSVSGNRSVTIDLESQSSAQLDNWWSEALFPVAQAMENRQYADIPSSLNALAAGINGLKVQTEIDAKNVYIHLSDGTDHKYIVLPRTPIELGVWNNESV